MATINFPLAKYRPGLAVRRTFFKEEICISSDFSNCEMSKLRRDVRSLTLQNKKARDYDPEDERSEEEEASGSDSEQENVNAGREHYERVGKSKLRQPEARSLGPKYSGVAVSRDALNEDDNDLDPFAERDLGVEEEDDPFAESDAGFESASDEDGSQPDAPQTTKSSLKGNELSDQEDGDMSDDDMSDLSHPDESGSDEEDDSEEHSDDEKGQTSAHQISSKRADLKAHLSQTSSLANGLAQAASSDAKKGQAVKAQYQTFDRLLDARMKLQKGFVASESVRVQSNDLSFAADAESAIAAAQTAALQLFKTISSFREDIYKASIPDHDSKKRKRQIDGPHELTSLWQEMRALEADAQPSRIKIIDKWSNKVRASDPSRMAATSKSKFNSSDQDDRVSTILQTYIINEQDKHFRTLSTADSDSGVDVSSYDDDMFYQSLLRDLIATRAATSNAAQNLSLSTLPHKLHPSGNKQQKQARDTKASKGRKIRYNVHEKLQNFMAAEGDTGRDTAMWTERGKNEFFGSLFGQDHALNEDEDMTEAEDGNAETEALRLFRA